MPGLGHAAAAGLAGGERDPEIGHQRLPVVQQDVLGLDVAVNDAVPVRVVERARDLARDPHRLVDRQLLLAVEPVAERLALDVRHDVVQEAVGGAGIEQREDVRVLQVRRGADLGQESLGADHRGELGPQHLDRDLAVVAKIVGEVDGRHAAGPELPKDAVAFGESESQTSQRVGHGTSVRECRDGV